MRSCVGALLVLIALALGREPLSLADGGGGRVSCRHVAWPESLVGPSFQMSFSRGHRHRRAAQCGACAALSGSARGKLAGAPGRRTIMLLVTGFVIEIALMPIVLFHFHRAGVYGALANVIAIPLVTFVSMPLIALALLFDSIGGWCTGLVAGRASRSIC